MLRRRHEIDLLAIIVDEARDERSRAESAQLLSVDRVGRIVTTSRAATSDSAQAAGLPRNANTSCTHTP